jgi:hypothetical protein
MDISARARLAPLNTGLYCETVMKTRQPLLVPVGFLDADSIFTRLFSTRSTRTGRRGG